MKAVLTSIFACSALPTAAFECNFATECYENEACTDSTFTLEADIEAQEIATEFGELIIVAVKSEENLMTLFATGPGAEYLMSLTPDAARLTTHVNDGPQSITYLGQCTGAF